MWAKYAIRLGTIQPTTAAELSSVHTNPLTHQHSFIHLYSDLYLNIAMFTIHIWIMRRKKEKKHLKTQTFCFLELTHPLQCAFLVTKLQTGKLQLQNPCDVHTKPPAYAYFR